MKYRIISAFGSYAVGQIVEPTGGYRDELLDQGRIAPVADPPSTRWKAKVAFLNYSKGQEFDYTGPLWHRWLSKEYIEPIAVEPKVEPLTRRERRRANVHD